MPNYEGGGACLCLGVRLCVHVLCLCVCLGVYVRCVWRLCVWFVYVFMFYGWRNKLGCSYTLMDHAQRNEDWWDECIHGWAHVQVWSQQRSSVGPHALHLPVPTRPPQSMCWWHVREAPTNGRSERIFQIPIIVVRHTPTSSKFSAAQWMSSTVCDLLCVYACVCVYVYVFLLLLFMLMVYEYVFRLLFMCLFMCMLMAYVYVLS